MSKLTATQLTILAAAAAREDGLAVRPGALRPAGAVKLAAKLIEEGLVREQRAKGDMPFWREDEQGRAFSLKILKAGRTAAQAMAPAGAESQSPALCGDHGLQADGAAAGAIPMPVTSAFVAKPGSKRALLCYLAKKAPRSKLSCRRRGGCRIPRAPP